MARRASGTLTALGLVGLASALPVEREESGTAPAAHAPLLATGPAASSAAPTRVYGLHAPPQAADAPYDGLYHFVRIQYGSRGGGFGGFGRRRGGGGMWAHDYPRAERNFLQIIDETTFVGTQTQRSNVLQLSDPELFKFPIAYIVEVGSWNPTDEEAEKLGEYLLKGGFLIVDDFRDLRNLANLEFQLERVLPGHSMIMIDGSQDIFDSFFRIVPEQVIPPYGPGSPVWYGVFEDNDPAKRMMIIVNYNNDIAEYWEFSDYGYYPIDLANEAYKLGVNYIVYGMTH